MIVLDIYILYLLKEIAIDIYFRLATVFPYLQFFASAYVIPCKEILARDFELALKLASDYLLLNFPIEYFRYIGFTLEMLKLGINVRLFIGWFPNFNPYGTIFEPLIATIDALFRPVWWFFPKTWWFDYSVWLPIFLLDAGIFVCKHLEDVIELGDAVYGQNHMKQLFDLFMVF